LLYELLKYIILMRVIKTKTVINKKLVIEKSKPNSLKGKIDKI